MKLSNIVQTKLDTLEDLNKYRKSYPLLSEDLKIQDIKKSYLENTYLLFGAEDKITGYVSSELILYLQEKLKDNILFDVLDKLNEAVIIIDENARIFYINPAYTAILKVLPNRVIGEYLKDLEHNARLLNVLETGQGYEKKNHYLQSIKKHVNVILSPIFKKDELVAAFSIFDDLTEVSNLNAKVARISSLARGYESQLQYREQIRSLNIIGKSRIFLDMLDQLIAAGKSDAPILITGESGSGKNVLANLLHKQSARSHMPYVSLNASAVADSLIETELFGYEKQNIKTGETQVVMGCFERADGGTLFIDEIGDMSLDMQAKILRALEKKEIHRMGSRTSLAFDVRIVASTNKDLKVLMDKGQFREDLYYRINVVPIKIPALRERKNDILLFMNHYLKKYNEKYEKDLLVSEEVAQAMLAYDWPGNVREIKNCLEQMVVLANNKMIQLQHLPEKIRPIQKTHFDAGLKDQLAIQERRILQDYLLRYHGDLVLISQALKISERSLYRKIKTYNLR